MMDCKKALTEAGGDFDKAIELLRKKGQKVSASRADRATSEGSVFVRTNNDSTKGLIVALGCETDFVAKNEEFQALGNLLADVAFNNSITSKDELGAFEVDGLSIDQRVTELVGKIGEKIEVLDVTDLSGEAVVPYIHAGSKLGVLVALKGVNGTDVTDAGKDVAMQIAAMNPAAVNKDGVDQATIDRELEIGKEQARAEGKPDDIIEKIAMGKLNKFFKENTLLDQAFVKDNSLSVQKYLDSITSGLTVDSFKRVAIG